MNHEIRDVVDDDWEAVTAIFNHFVRNSLAAYPDEVVDNDLLRNKRNQFPDFPFLVVEVDGAVVGFAYLSPIHFASTMRSTAALTYFLHPDVTGGGIGTHVLTRLMRMGAGLGVTNYLANISSHNTGSVRFHQRNGFVECGRFLRVGRKFGRDFDMVWMQRIEDGSQSGTAPETN